MTIVQGENLTLYGVTRPIATKLTGAGSAWRYVPDDQIVMYVYENATLGAFTFTGCLEREFEDGYVGYANYEFGHAFTETAVMPPGTWLLSVSAYNSTGALVEKTNRTIELEVTAASPGLPTVIAVAAPASTPAPRETPGFGVVLVLVGLTVAVVVRRG